ncbi:MAG: amidohydrolase family protein [Bacteriovoracaceae bacterium]|nr:amidohydrolase family protein [Bacteriovoracaceae bacterium]
MDNIIDSHVHWLATGEHATHLSLHNLTDPFDVQNLQVFKQHFRGEWIIGVGWDYNRWINPKYPQKEVLDKVFPNNPVAFSSVDGHALWINSQAAKLLQLDLSKCLNKCIVFDKQMELVYKHMPQISDESIHNFLLEGQNVFLKAGFLFIRDMSCSMPQWNQAIKLDKEGLLEIHIDQYFSVDGGQSFSEVLKMAQIAKKDKCKNLTVKGIKVYYDGALGSDGAYLSLPYQNIGKYNWCGRPLMTNQELADIFITSWNSGFDVSVHALGDEATHQIVTTANSLWDNGHLGNVHLEHCEIVRDETINLMRDRPYTCHMQPCHWLSDKAWIDKKVAPELKKYLFPWRKLEQNNIALFFGSDSPIEPSSLGINQKAIFDASKYGIDPPKSELLRFHRI